MSKRAENSNEDDLVLYGGSVEERRALWHALQELHAEGFSDQTIIATLDDYRATGRLIGVSGLRRAVLSRPTLNRMRLAKDPTLNGFRRGTVELLFNFLRNCPDLPSSLYLDAVRLHSVHRLAPVSEAIQRYLGRGGGPLTNADLSKLVGTFHLYRKAWTSISEASYVQCILRFDQVGDGVFYTEEQSFFDTCSKLSIEETDHGVVVPFGMNVVMIGRGAKKNVLKFFSIHEMTPFPDGPFPVQQLSGNFIAVYSKGPHPGFGAFARRVDPDEAYCAFFGPGELPETIIDNINRASRI